MGKHLELLYGETEEILFLNFLKRYAGNQVENILKNNILREMRCNLFYGKTDNTWNFFMGKLVTLDFIFTYIDCT